MKRVFLFFIGIYRKYLSGLKAAPCCRFTPTCSEYTYRAREEWGAIVGVLLGIFRILRCNPLFPGGEDHIPLRGAKKRSAEGYTVFYARSPYGRHCGDRAGKSFGKRKIKKDTAKKKSTQDHERI